MSRTRDNWHNASIVLHILAIASMMCIYNLYDVNGVVSIHITHRHCADAFNKQYTGCITFPTMESFGQSIWILFVWNQKLYLKGKGVLCWDNIEGKKEIADCTLDVQPLSCLFKWEHFKVRPPRLHRTFVVTSLSLVAHHLELVGFKRKDLRSVQWYSPNVLLLTIVHSALLNSRYIHVIINILAVLYLI